MTTKRDYFGEWLAASDEEHWSPAATYATKEEAIAHAVDDLDLEPGQAFWVGQASEPSIVEPLDGAMVVDAACEALSSEVGEAAEEWPDATDSQILELEHALNEAFHAWVKRNGLEPTCFIVEHVEQHRAPEVKP